MRLFRFDKPKSLTQTRKELGKLCSIPNCGKPLTHMKGPGSLKLCREHQIKDQSYEDGYGRIDRLYTFHRSDICECCGQDINNDIRWELAQTFFGLRLSEEQKHEIKRRYNHGDHEHRKVDGGDDSKDNTNAFCTFCHWVKTVINNDGRKRNI